MNVFGGAESLLQTGKPSKSLNLNTVLTGIQGYKIAKGEVKISDPSEIFSEIENEKQNHKNKFWTKTSSKIWKNRRRVDDGTTIGETGVRLSSPLVDYEDDEEKQSQKVEEETSLPSSKDNEENITKKKENVKKVDYFGIAKLDDDYQSEEEEEQEIESKGTKRKMEELLENNGQVLNIPESLPDVWNWQKVKFQNRYSSLSTNRCWKCRKTGHLPDDCVSSIGIPSASPSDPYHYTVTKGKEGENIYSALLKQYYKRCNKISKQKGAKCSQCSSFANLAHCLDCGQNFCDGSGHLTQHLRDFPAHNKIYSFKLKRQLKCFHSTCEEMDVYNLLACPTCLEKYFNKYYSMVTAVWSAQGMKLIPKTLCCEEHYIWHTMNCFGAHGSDSNHFVEKEKLENEDYGKLLNEYFF